jgi:hypothetical protein
MTFAALKLAICDVTASAPLLRKLLTALHYAFFQVGRWNPERHQRSLPEASELSLLL